jgi:hypothetical protein
LRLLMIGAGHSGEASVYRRPGVGRDPGRQ